ncbi:3-isopropylmalate dehydratase [Alkalihalobacillus sp. BA299]|uniref:3-isopropylmalate dehydratase n=1 Tax=Alkalihalobacillus sp. BA299 TaxID=2815938 RepID=UPI001ADA046A|nr:3-isopropylmalate dehydratase [Alkalihalobacillus sp. BA299]
MLPTINGRIAWIFKEANYDIDLIVGVDNIKTKDIEKLKEVCMKEYDPNFKTDVREGDVIVGGENFGYGHPHYPSCRALRALGIKAIIAESFSPGFYRGESTNGFPLIECPGISTIANRWDRVHFNWETEKLSFPDKDIELPCNKVPQKTKDLIVHGGIIEYLKHTRLKSI